MRLGHGPCESHPPPPLAAGKGQIGKGSWTNLAALAADSLSGQVSRQRPQLRPELRARVRRRPELVEHLLDEAIDRLVAGRQPCPPRIAGRLGTRPRVVGQLGGRHQLVDEGVNAASLVELRQRKVGRHQAPPPYQSVGPKDTARLSDVNTLALTIGTSGYLRLGSQLVRLPRVLREGFLGREPVAAARTLK